MRVNSITIFGKKLHRSCLVVSQSWRQKLELSPRFFQPTNFYRQNFLASRFHQKNANTKLENKILLSKQTMSYKRRAPNSCVFNIDYYQFRRCREQDQFKRRFRFKKILSEERKERGEWENLFCELDERDREYYCKYLRIFVLSQNVLCIYLPPVLLITNQDTNYQNCILARKRLVITLHYLAQGCSRKGCIFTIADNLS